jgi:formylglycine-generating enzyme required for sulfatase activity
MLRVRSSTCLVFAVFLCVVSSLSVAVAESTLPAPAAAPDTGMVLLPAGEFVMGREGQGDNSPAHKVRISAFHLDRCEVTNAQYEAFCKATGTDLPMFWGMDTFRSGPGYPNHPVVGVSWSDARDYARWCGKRLPTEAEWEYAARGGLAGMPYVTGNTLDSSKVNFTRSQQGGPVRVGSYAPNGYGLHDMAGNVLEWVADRYDTEYFKNSPPQDPPGPEKGRFRVIRGGGWHTGPGCMGVGYRNALPSNWLDFNVGFRCARDVKPGAIPERE